MARVSVIIPVFNDAERLAKCLDALSKQTMSPAEFEVLVVDNGSTESPLEVVSPYAFARLLHETKPGSYAARNRGLAEANGSMLAFTDSDCVPRAEWLASGIGYLEADEGCGLVAGRIEVVPADANHVSAAEWFDCVFGLRQDLNVERLGGSATANTFTRREVFDRVGEFDGTLKSGGDIEWGQRVTGAGYGIVYAADAVVQHPARRSVNELIVQARRHSGGRMDKAKRRPPLVRLARKLRGGLRLLVPPVKLMRRAAVDLRGRGVSWSMVLKVWGVLILRRYAILLESIRVSSGAKSVRR